MRKIWPSKDNCIKLRDNFARWKSRNCNLCMPYWIRDQEGRLVRIENPQDTELDICVNIMDPPPEDQNSQQGQGAPYCALLPTFHGMESENPYSHIKEFEEDQWVEETNRKFFSLKKMRSSMNVGKGIWRPSMLVLIMVLIHGSYKNQEAMDFLSYVVEVSRGWDEPNSREKGKFPSQQTQNPKAGMYMLSEDVDMKAKVATLARRLEELELKKIHEVQAISDTQVHVMPCTICQSCDQVNVVGQFRPNNGASYGNTYNSSWRNHPNFSWKPRPPPYQPQGQTQAPQQPS
ncbi:hypothetical protein AAG906_013820 [Vitis piasezkii]